MSGPATRPGPPRIRSPRVAPARIAALYRAACLAELAALKPGNVHVHAAGHRMEVADFRRSAEVSAPEIARAGARVGARVEAGVAATRAAVGQNTNLGILLLCAPLARAAETGAPVAAVLSALDASDSAGVYAAIRAAAPGGLGASARHDVAAAAPADLREAMREAAPRDRIARAYAGDFADLPAVGLAALACARAHGLDAEWSATAVHLAYLAAFPDSHVGRKHGPETAEAVRAEAASRTGGLDLSARPVEALLAYDADLKARGINPGTSADLTVATLFWDGLESAGARLGAP